MPKYAVHAGLSVVAGARPGVNWTTLLLARTPRRVRAHSANVMFVTLCEPRIVARWRTRSTATPSSESRRPSAARATGEALERNLDRVVELIEGAVWAYSQWGAPVRLVCLPEFCLQGIPYYSRDELERNGVLLRADGPELARLARLAREHDVLIHCGTILEADDAYPGLVFNTAVVVGADGVVLRYRKVNSWIPIETFASPHLVEGYDEELFPVADTPLGRIACLTCYDALFPETYREVASKGAEIVLLANALPESVADGVADAVADDRPAGALARERRDHRQREPGRRSRAVPVQRRQRRLRLGGPDPRADAPARRAVRVRAHRPRGLARVAPHDLPAPRPGAPARRRLHVPVAHRRCAAARSRPTARSRSAASGG